MTHKKLLGLSGSLRKDSFCSAVLRAIQAALPSESQLTIHSLADVPLYNQDDDGEAAPPWVRALREAIAGSDGVIMISPEYNHGMSGVLKNALDWASRPYGQSSLLRKPVLTMSASPAFTGGVRAQQQMNETLLAIPARPVLRPQTVIGTVHEKIQDNRLTDKTTVGFVMAGVRELLDEIGSTKDLGLAVR
jgi:chromate reductase, NAD(P)H dehydrogenase (quinone)